jgi:hypothetical protein
LVFQAMIPRISNLFLITLEFQIIPHSCIAFFNLYPLHNTVWSKIISGNEKWCSLQIGLHLALYLYGILNS